tara:strand:- start:385 stop:1692 length:1308 start_codon:yes stop_codon:yes gene_type:complete
MANIAFYGQNPIEPLRVKSQRDFDQDSRRRMAQQLAMQGGSMAPVQSHTEGIARALQGGLSGLLAGKARRDKEDRDEALDLREKAYSGGLNAVTTALTNPVVEKQRPDPEFVGPMPARSGMEAALAAIPAGNSDFDPLRSNLALNIFKESQAKAQLEDQRAYELANPPPPSGRQSTVLQIADRLTGLYNALAEEPRPEVKRQIQAKIDRLNIIIAKDPEVLKAQAYGKKKGAGTAETEIAPKLEASKAIGKGMGTKNMDLYNTTQNALETLQKSTDLITQLKTSDATTGFGADMITGINKLKATMGSGDAYKKVTDTQVLNAMMGSEVFGLMKSLGVGARGLDTPAEREFMREVLTGTLTLNKDTLIKMAELRQAISQRAIDKWNEKSNAGELDLFYQATGIAKKDIIFAPATSTPANSANNKTPPLPPGFVVQN